MRNLAGRLNNRSLPSLMSIADEWKIPVSAREKHALVGEVYRGMRDIRAVRDEWENLDAREQEIVRLLSVARDAQTLSVTIRDLAALTNDDFDAAWDVAASLYRKGIISRESDDDEIPIGESPRIFLPRELSLLFRRVQDEIDAGDISQTQVEALLEWLDDAEIEHAAAIWGKKSTAGVARREDLTVFLHNALTEPGTRADVIAHQSDMAQLVMANMAKRPVEALVPIDELFAGVSLPESVRVKTAARRKILSDLESSLLIWHSYTAQGERRWFRANVGSVPHEPGTDIPVTPVALEDHDVELVRSAIPYHVTWDQLTLLRWLHGPNPPQVRELGATSTRWQESVNARLWHPEAGSESIVRYLDFLVSLARSEDVIAGGANEKSNLQIGPGWDYWRNRSFREQTSRLLWFWISHQDWIERGAQPTVIAEGVSWARLRKRLLVRLAELEARRWYVVDDAAKWIVGRDQKAMLDERSRLELVAIGDRRDDPIELQTEALREIVKSLIQTSFAWFGFVEVGNLGRGRRAFRPTEFLDTFSRSEPLPDLPVPAGPALSTDNELVITLHAPTPIRIWALSAFADQEELRPEAVYRITESSLARSLQSGSRLEDVIGFLQKQQGAVLNDTQRDHLAGMAGEFRRVWIAPQFTLTVDDEADREVVEGLVAEAGLRYSMVEGNIVITLDRYDDPDRVNQRIFALLQSSGLSPHRKTMSAAKVPGNLGEPSDQ